MLDSKNDEEQTARVEKMLEEFRRGPVAAEPAAFVLLTGWPETAPPVTAKPKLTLVAKPK
jgi:hypothetical protein